MEGCSGVRFWVRSMIDSIFNLIFRCRHGRLSRPITPIDAAGVPQGSPYVVCLDCGKHIEFDAIEMRIGKVIKNSLSS